MNLATLPSPPISTIPLGPLTIHIYALCILTGIAVAMTWARRRWAAKGGEWDDLFDIVFAAVIAGIIGARLYHVLITDPASYVGPHGDPLAILRIWEGGLGIGGAVVGGGLAAFVMARRKHVPFAVVADTIAPTLMVAQVIGRLGNWFNQELHGGATDLPWGLRITCITNGQTIQGCTPGVYHPTFLYEALWNLSGCLVLLWLERRFRLGGGRVFFGYAAIYSFGRVLTELLREDPALMILGIRVHIWVYAAVFAVALVSFLVLTARARRRGERRVVTEPGAADEAERPAAVAADG